MPRAMVARLPLACVAVAVAALLGCAGGSVSPPFARPPMELPDSVEYVARGNEPFWTVIVSREGVTYREPERPDGLTGSLGSAFREANRLVFRTVLNDAAAVPLELTLDEKPCQDSMAGDHFAYTATVRFGAREMTGCGERRQRRAP